MITYLLLSCVSLAMMFSIAPERLLAQATFFAVGLGLYYYLSRQDHAVYSAIAPYCYPLAFLLLASTFVFGDEVRGAARWIDIGSFQLQPSEFAKPLLILAFAHLLTRFRPDNLANLTRLIGYFLPPFLLVYFQPDLGTALVLASMFAFQVFLSGLPWRYVGTIGAVLIVLAAAAPAYLAPYQRERLTSFANPTADPLGSGYNVIQSVIAVGSGGVLGKGLGQGTQSHLRFLPERHTDFMFASLAEELGLAGSAAVVGLLTLLIYHFASLTLIIRGTPRLILAGVTGYLFFQTFINLGMNIGLAPVTGVTLPLVSYGGSSILALSLALGLAGSAGRSRPLPPALEIV